MIMNGLSNEKMWSVVKLDYVKPKGYPQSCLRSCLTHTLIETGPKNEGWSKWITAIAHRTEERHFVKLKTEEKLRRMYTVVFSPYFEVICQT